MKRLKRWVRNEPGLKIISLVLAVVLWFYISGEVTEDGPEKETRLFKRIPVEVMGDLESFGTSVKLDPETVDLEVAAPAEVFDSLVPGEIKAYVEVEGLSRGKYALPLQTVLPAGVVLVSEKQRVKVEVGVLGKSGIE